jgi:hypothetical protein
MSKTLRIWKPAEAVTGTTNSKAEFIIFTLQTAERVSYIKITFVGLVVM